VHDPALLRGIMGRIQFASQAPKMLTGMIEIDDLNGAGKVLLSDVSDPA